MHTYIDQLMALSRQIPESIAEEDLPRLEEAATGFQHLFKQVKSHAAGSGINTLYYSQRLKHIESALFEAKYGRDQKQRDTAFKRAKRELAAGIGDLIGFIKSHTPSSSN